MSEAELADRYKLDNWNEERKDAEIARLQQELGSARGEYSDACNSLRRRHDEITKLRAELALLKAERDLEAAKRAAMLAVLKQHHKWQLEIGEAWFASGPDGHYALDLSAEYADSTMCEQTFAILTNPDPAADALLRDREIAEAARENLKWLDSKNIYPTQVVSFWEQVRASMPATEAEENPNG